MFRLLRMLRITAVAFETSSLDVVPCAPARSSSFAAHHFLVSSLKGLADRSASKRARASRSLSDKSLTQISYPKFFGPGLVLPER